jgi:hypothetical protein
VESLNDFWKARDERNRLIRGEWSVGLNSEDETLNRNPWAYRGNHSEAIGASPQGSALCVHLTRHELRIVQQVGPEKSKSLG